MRAALLLLFVAAGCADIAGIDDWSPATTSATSTATGSGGAGTTGGSSATGGGADDRGGAGGKGAGGGCESLKCFWGSPTMSGSAPCDAKAASGTCVPQGHDYCDCAGQVPALFVELDDNGVLVAATLIANEANQPFSLGVNTACADQTVATSCESYCVTGRKLYRWEEFGGVPADKITSLHVWIDDTGDVCVDGDGGTVEINVDL